MTTEVRVNGSHYATDYNGSGSGITGLTRTNIANDVPNSVVVNGPAGEFSSIGVLNVGRGGTGLSTTGISSVFVTDNLGVPSWSTALPAGVLGTISHSGLSNLSNDDHLQYAKLTGRGTGQTLIGGVNTGNNLTLQSTTDVTRGKIIINDDLAVNTIDSRTVTTLSIGTTTANRVEISSTGITTDINGPLNVESAIDTNGAAILYLGPANALSVEIADTGILTSLLGPSEFGGTLDTVGGAIFKIAPSNALSVEIGKLGAMTTIKGNATIIGTTTVGGIIDTASALQLGPVTASSVNVANSSITTNVLGKLVVKDVIDTTSGLQLGPLTATSVSLAKSGITTSVLGMLRVKDIIDTTSATILKIAPADATAVEIADTGVTTTIKGSLFVESVVDSAGILKLGGTATSVEVGKSGGVTTIKGDLNVLGTTTQINSEVVNITDNFLYLNQGHTALSTETGGLAVNYLPTATTTTATGSGFTAATTVSTVGAATFAANDIIQISGAVNVDNNGLFVVASHAASVLTISTTVYGWNQTQFTVSVDAVAVITKVNISAIRANTSGNWEVGKGNVVPLVFAAITTSPQMWTFHPVNGSFAATSLSYQTIGYFAFDLPAMSPVVSFVVTYYVDYTDRALDIQIWDGGVQLGADLAVAVSGIRSFSPTIPVVDKKIEVRIRKTAGSGTSPVVSSVQFVLNA